MINFIKYRFVKYNLNFSKKYYETLNLPNYSDIHEIKDSFVKLSKIHHPDISKNSNKYWDIKEAYDVLNKKYLKEEYDTYLKDKEQKKYQDFNYNYKEEVKNAYKNKRKVYNDYQKFKNKYKKNLNYEEYVNYYNSYKIYENNSKKFNQKIDYNNIIFNSKIKNAKKIFFKSSHKNGLIKGILDSFTYIIK